jgi:hypothetical protein
MVWQKDKFVRYILVCADCGWLVPRHQMGPGKQSERKDIKHYIISKDL